MSTTRFAHIDPVKHRLFHTLRGHLGREVGNLPLPLYHATTCKSDSSNRLSPTTVCRSAPLLRHSGHVSWHRVIVIDGGIATVALPTLARNLT